MYWVGVPPASEAHREPREARLVHEPLGADGAHVPGDRVEGLVPAHRHEPRVLAAALARVGALHGLADAVRVVGLLDEAVGLDAHAAAARVVIARIEVGTDPRRDPVLDLDLHEVRAGDALVAVDRLPGLLRGPAASVPGSVCVHPRSPPPPFPISPRTGCPSAPRHPDPGRTSSAEPGRRRRFGAGLTHRSRPGAVRQGVRAAGAGARPRRRSARALPARPSRLARRGLPLRDRCEAPRPRSRGPTPPPTNRAGVAPRCSSSTRTPTVSSPSSRCGRITSRQVCSMSRSIDGVE